MGNIGAHDRYEYCALGDIVNTASRIEGLRGDSRFIIGFVGDEEPSPRVVWS